jgi:signal peptidase II
MNARRIAAFVTAIAVFALDRWTKSLVETRMSAYDSKTVIPGFFNIVRSDNTGVAFGMFASSSTSSTYMLIGISLLAVLLLASMLWRIERLDTPSAAGLALIFGGALGNVYDRVAFGRVTDFLDFYAGTYHWYTFNLADSSIFTGACLLLIGMWIGRVPETSTRETKA